MLGSLVTLELVIELESLGFLPDDSAYGSTGVENG